MSTNIGGVSVAVSLDIKQATAELDKLKKKIEDTFNRANYTSGKNALAPMTRSAGQANTRLNTLNKTTGSLRRSITQLGMAATYAGKNPMAALSSASAGASEAVTALGGASSATAVALGAVGVAAIAAGAAIGGITYGIFKLGKMGYETGKDLEVLSLSMEAITGSAIKANKEVKALQDIAVESPFLTTSIINLDKFLMSQGVAAGKLRGDLIKAVLDLSAALGLADENIGSISYALAQVQARSYLSGDEMRQLANQFIPVMEALKSMPKYADLSTAAIRKMIEEGKISSEEFFEALINYTDQYDGIAQRAAETTDGLLNKLEDVTKIRLGQAFNELDTSPLAGVRDILYEITQTLEQVDWRPFAHALGEITSIFTDWAAKASSSSAIVTFFNEWLPGAIHTASKWIRYFIEVEKYLMGFQKPMIDLFADAWNTLVDVLKQLGISWTTIFKIMGAAVVGLYVVIVGPIQMTIAAFGALAAAAAAIIGILGAVSAAMALDFEAAAKSWDAGITAAQGAVTMFGDMITTMPKMTSHAVTGFNDLGKAIAGIAAIRMPKWWDDMTSGGAFADKDSVLGGAAPTATGGGGGGSGGRAAAKSISELAKLMDELYKLTQRWRGMRSEMEVGLLGKEGFTATIEEIWKMGKKLDQAMMGLGRTDVADWLYSQTVKLVELAKKRNELIDELNEAQSKLDQLISDRNRFADQLKQSALKFAGALKVETKTVKSFEQFSERGFFIESEEQQNKSITESLKERSQALKDYFNNIKYLKNAGLDSDVLRDLLTAGPEASKDVVAALVDGGQEMVDNVNVLYGDIRTTADALAEYGASEFYDAGVEQAEALVEGLQEEIDSVTEQAEAIGEAMYEAVLPFAKELEKDLGTSGKTAGGNFGGGVASGISAAKPKIGVSMAGIDDELTRGTGKWSQTLDKWKGESKFEGITDGWLKTLQENSDKMTHDVETMVLDINSWLDKLKTPNWDFGLNFDYNEVKRTATRWWQAIKSGIRSAIGGVGRTALGLVPGGQKLWDWIHGRSYSSGDHVLGPYATPDATTMVGSMAYTSAGTGSSGGPYYGGQPDSPSMPTIKVYIGERELTDIVRTEVVYNDGQQMKRVLTGRRN